MAATNPPAGKIDEYVPEHTMGLFEWLNKHIWPIAALLVVLGVTLAALFPVIADDGEPSFDPTGEIYETQDRVDSAFATSSPIRGVSFIVESPDGGDVLTRDALLELKQNQAALLADPVAQEHLATSFDRDLGIPVTGIFSLADAVDAALPGGLEAATNADVKLALSELLADDAPTSSLRFLLSTTSTTREPTTINGQPVVVWESPAFFATLLYDFDSFDEPAEESFGDTVKLGAERWLRSVQVDLRGEQKSVTVIGLAIDGGLISQEQGEAAGPYIFGAVAFILLFVGALLRSYWAAMVVAAGLGIVMMGYNGMNAILGLKTGSPLLIMIVPIALISFGVDFFIHASGRTREMQVDGFSRKRAYPLGMTAVFAALLLAALSSAAAFLSNTVSGIPAIIQFGVAAAVGLLISYLILGWVAPKVLLSIESHLGPRPADLSHWRTVTQKIGFVIASFIAGIAVTMAIVFPAVGWAGYLLFLLFLIYVPYLFTRRRNRRAAAAERPTTDAVKGAGHGFKAAGTVVHFLARWRVFTVPVVAVLAVLGLIAASNVERGFEVKDFFSSKTDFVIGLDKLETYYGGGGGDIDYVYVEGDLTSPDTLIALVTTEGEIDAAAAVESDVLGAPIFIRDFNGNVEFRPNAVTVVRLATASETSRAAIAAETGVTITDTDGNGFPDDSTQVAAIYDYVQTNGVVNDAGEQVFRPDQIETFLFLEDGTQGTVIALSMATFTEDEVILAGRAVLDEAATGLESSLSGESVAIFVSGGAITAQNTLESFMNAMLMSLPVAVLLTSLLVFITLFFVFRKFGRRMASILKRSTRYALVSMVPILLVVAWVYGFMYLVGYRVNMITATIAAIAIGVGVDYATHFTMRFIEEFENEPSRFPALRRAGEGTGGALTISAATSITGFLVMAAAPMPMFQTFGVLTAVMIFFSWLVSLLVLPSLLMLITPSRKGDEREQMIGEVTHGGDFEYEPHARETAVRTGGDAK